MFSQANHSTLPMTARPITPVHEVQHQEAGAVQLGRESPFTNQISAIDRNHQTVAISDESANGKGGFSRQQSTWPSSVVPRRSQQRSGGEWRHRQMALYSGNTAGVNRFLGGVVYSWCLCAVCVDLSGSEMLKIKLPDCDSPLAYG